MKRRQLERELLQHRAVNPRDSPKSSSRARSQSVEMLTRRVGPDKHRQMPLHPGAQPESSGASNDADAPCAEDDLLYSGQRPQTVSTRYGFEVCSLNQVKSPREQPAPPYEQLSVGSTHETREFKPTEQDLIRRANILEHERHEFGEQLCNWASIWSDKDHLSASDWLQQEAQRACEDISRLQSQVDALEERASKQADEICESQQTLQEARLQLEQQTTRSIATGTDDKTQQLEEAWSKIQQMQEVEAAAQLQIKQLEEAQALSMSREEESDKRIVALEQALLKNTTKEMGECLKERDTLAAQVQALAEERDSLQAQLVQATQECSEANERVSRALHDQELLYGEAEALRAQQKEARDKEAEANSNFFKTAEHCDAAEAQIIELTAQVDRAEQMCKGILDELKSVRMAKQQNDDAHMLEVQQLESEVEQLSTQSSWLKKDNMDTKQQLEAALEKQEQLEIRSTRLEAAETNCEDLLQKIGEMESELEELRPLQDENKVLLAREQEWAALAAREATLVEQAQLQTKQFGEVQRVWEAERRRLEGRILQLETNQELSQQSSGAVESSRVAMGDSMLSASKASNISEGLRRQKQELQRQLKAATEHLLTHPT